MKIEQKMLYYAVSISIAKMINRHGEREVNPSGYAKASRIPPCPGADQGG